MYYIWVLGDFVYLVNEFWKDKLLFLIYTEQWSQNYDNFDKSFPNMLFLIKGFNMLDQSWNT